MKSSMKDKVKGTFHEAKGKVEEMAGKITDNPKLEAEGNGSGKIWDRRGEQGRGGHGEQKGRRY